VEACLRVGDARLCHCVTVVVAEQDNETGSLTDEGVQSERKWCSDVQGRLAEAVGCPKADADCATEPMVEEFVVGLGSAGLPGLTTWMTLQDR